jgi:serine/threonine-protein kinase
VSLGDGWDGDHPRVGSYRLIRRLGRGSQGEVWKAVRLEPPVEVVALKVLSALGRHDPRKFARFRREAVRGAGLAGRGILPIYEFGEEGPVAFFAMPLVEGFTLARVLDQRRRHRAGETPIRWHRLALLPEPLYIDAVARVLARVARALGDVHAARVVHCDVKPANLLLERGVAGRAYLIDFGLGRDLDAMPVSRSRTVDGTMLYMAPEKLSGWQADEALCDIYALGATGFEALALRRPRALPEGLPRRLWARYLAEAVPPRLGTIVPGLPEDLGAMLERAMTRDPTRRYQSAVAMAEDLERYLGVAVAR